MTPRYQALERLAIRLADTAFFEGADCTCAPRDECLLCEAFRVLGEKARPEWRAPDAVRCDSCRRKAATHRDIRHGDSDAGPCCGSPGCCVMVDRPDLPGWTRGPLSPTTANETPEGAA